MRIRIIAAMLLLMIVVAACSGDKPQSSSLVTKAGVAPHYVSLDDALAAARADQYVVLGFYTDW